MKTRLSFLGLFAIVSSLWLVHATNTANSEYVTHSTSSLNFSATYADGKVSTSRWNFAVPTGQSWQYRKVVRSSTNANPVYPDDGYIYYGGELSTSSYTDTNPSVGTNYYRVCAITQWKENRHRYCSNVKMIKVTSSTSSDDKETVKETVQKEKEKKNTSVLSVSKKAVVDKMIENYMTKLNAKYTTDVQKIAQLEKTIASVSAIKSSRLKTMYAYMAEKLEEELEALELSNVLQLD